MKNIGLVCFAALLGLVLVNNPVFAGSCCGGDTKDVSKCAVENGSISYSAYSCPRHPEITSDKPGKCSKCGMDLVLKKVIEVDNYTVSGNECNTVDTECNMEGSGGTVVAVEKTPVVKAKKMKAAKAVYFCPMHPEVTSNKRGKCPKCKMKLELKTK